MKTLICISESLQRKMSNYIDSCFQKFNIKPTTIIKIENFSSSGNNKIEKFANKRQLPTSSISIKDIDNKEIIDNIDCILLFSKGCSKKIQKILDKMQELNKPVFHEIIYDNEQEF